MIAVDTNILIYAHREEASFHESAKRGLIELAESGRPWAIPWPCLHEFLAIMTHPKIYRPPVSLKDAMIQVESLLACPSLEMLSEGVDYWQILEGLLKASGVKGPRIHDARIAALCLANHVRELWSADRDFSRFKALKVRNPL